MVEDFIIPLTAMDRSSRQKINKDTLALNGILELMNLINIYRTFHPKTAEYTFLSSAYGTFPRIYHMLGQKISLGKFRKLKSYAAFLLTTCYKTINQLKGKNCKNTNTWRLNNILRWTKSLFGFFHNILNLNKLFGQPNTTKTTNGSLKKLKNKVKNTSRQMKLKRHDPKSMGCSKSCAKKKVYSDTSLPQERRKISNKQPNLTLKGTRKRRASKPKIGRRKEIIKIRAEINKIKTKKIIQKINESKSWFYEKTKKNG